MENNFFNQIRKEMNSPPNYPVNEQLWDKLEARLDKRKEPKRGLLWAWLPWGLAIGAVAVAGILYLSQSKTMAQLSQLKQAIHEQNTQTAGLITSQTNQIKQQVVVYDTIFNTVVVNRHEDNLLNTKASFPAYSANLLFGGNRTANVASLLPGSFIHTSPSPFVFNSNKKSQPQNKYSKSDATTVKAGYSPDEKQVSALNLIPDINSSLAFLPSHLLPISRYENKEDIEFIPIQLNKTTKKKKRKPADYYLTKLRPTGAAISGYIHRSHLLNLSSDINRARDWSELGRGLRFEISYGKPFSFIIGLENRSDNFDFLYENNEKLLIGFPDIPSGNPGDVLHEVYGEFKYIQVPFGIKYKLVSKGWLHPYVGLGLVSKKAVVSNLKFEYFSFMQEYYVERQNLIPEVFQVDDMWTILGFQFNLKNNWNLFVEGSSQFSLKQTGFRYENTQMIKWNLGIHYQF